jgi:uncharacterized protein (DUF2141 family)
MKNLVLSNQNVKAIKSVLLTALVVFNLFFQVFGQIATQVDVSGTTTTNTINNNVSTVVDPNLVVNSNGTINGFIVTITGTYMPGDVLTYTGALPSGITSSPFNTLTHSLVFSGTTTAANWQTLLRTVKLQTVSATCFPESRQVSFIAGNAYYNPLNGHFYYQSTANTSWTDAKNNAALSSLFGLQGYLATVTSQAENSFISVLLGQDSWIGCSDRYSEINTALGYTLYASSSNSGGTNNNANAEGYWYWVTGPERGTKMRNGNDNNQNNYHVGAVVAGIYQNWAGSEPNDWNSTSFGDEDYGHMYTSNGLWNDYPNTSSIRSVWEYGGMPNDNTNSQIVFTRNLYINGAPSGTISGGNVTVCSGTNSTVLTLTGFTGTVVRWEYSLDNFLTSPVTVASTSISLTVTNLTQTRYYRAIVNSSSGCSNLATSSTPIYISNTIAGNIVATNNTICPGSQASFSLFGNNGNVVSWQVSTSSTFASGNTTIANTTNALNYTLNTAGTYYFRALVQNNGCTQVYTPGYTITVTAGTPPVGGTVSNAQHCSGSASGTLTLSGHTGSVQYWQYSVDGGIVWTNVSNTTTSIAYSNLTADRKYRAILANGSCGTATSSIGQVTVIGANVCVWIGTTSTDWGTSANWQCGVIGDLGKDVLVSSTATYDLHLDQARTIGSFNFNGSNKTVVLGANTLTANYFIGANATNRVKTNGAGKLKMNVGNASSLAFPVGNSAYNPVTITNNSGNTDAFSVRVLDEVYANGYSGTVITTPRVKRTWDISKTYANAGSGVGFVFNWNAGEDVNITAPLLNHFNGTDWDAQNGANSYTTYSLNYFSYTGTFSPFAISSVNNPLPVELTSFQANCLENEGREISWSTASEHNSSYFEVLKSRDGYNWSSIKVMSAAGNSSIDLNYSFIDEDKTNGIIYYKLVQVDIDGAQKVYDAISSDCNLQQETIISIYPNPSAQSFMVQMDLENDENIEMVIYNLNGSVAYRQAINGNKGSNTIFVNDLNLKSGFYNIYFTQEAGKSIIIKHCVL